MKLFIEVTFDHELSDRAQADVKHLVQDLKDELADFGGKVTRADLVAAPPSEPPTT